MTSILKIRDLSAGYGKLLAVSGISLTVEKGQIITIIGPNGAGKTTLLKAVMGLLPAGGSLEFGGRPLGNVDVEERVALGMSLVPEKRELFGDMSVADNLLLGAYTRRREREATAAEVYELFPRLRERRDQRAATLSGGERQMLALGRAMMARPQLLMLDEPSLGLAPLVVRETLRSVVALRELGVSVLLVEQNARAALQIADFAYVLENGQVSLSGTGAELMHDQRVQSTYLGH